MLKVKMKTIKYTATKKHKINPTTTEMYLVVLFSAPLAIGGTADAVADAVVDTVVAVGVCAASVVTGVSTLSGPFSWLAGCAVAWLAPLCVSAASAAW